MTMTLVTNVLSYLQHSTRYYCLQAAGVKYLNRYCSLRSRFWHISLVLTSRLFYVYDVLMKISAIDYHHKKVTQMTVRVS